MTYLNALVAQTDGNTALVSADKCAGRQLKKFKVHTVSPRNTTVVKSKTIKSTVLGTFTCARVKMAAKQPNACRINNRRLALSYVTVIFCVCMGLVFLFVKHACVSVLAAFLE